MACMKWLPPIESAYPSPVITHTLDPGGRLMRWHRRGAPWIE